MIVYRVSSPNGKSYIGATTFSLQQRKVKHLSAARCGSKLKFHKAIRKYGDKLNWEILAKTDCKNRAVELERLYIEKFDTLKNGYNGTLGGEGVLGLHAFLGKTHSEEYKRKMSKIMKGRKVSKKTREKISKSKTGSKVPVEVVKKQLASRGMKSFFILKDDKVLGSFSNHCECARVFNLNRNLISHCLNNPNNYKSHKGYTFRYVMEDSHG